ncbi:hypothetical protein [uncultured Thiocystis sp.]|jgi:hypothetical protein|uniref:hypothetical protein n=1 Tax=uncultured Thiocystis sp. TaxID=1202134 RepID=UPI0025CE797A|nr:hypothetical protein [uncultured Thiocystis sp.]
MTMSVGGVEIGECLFGTEVGIVDYSRKERDAFGNLTLIERGYADLVNFTAVIATANAHVVRALLASKRATSAVYVGHADHDVLKVTGYLNQFSIRLDNWNTSTLTLEVEGEVHG